MSTSYWFITGLLQPFTVLVVGLGLLIFWPRSAGAPRRRWLKVWYVLFYIYCTPLAAYTATWWLEQPFSKSTPRPSPLDGIVVLGGGIVSSDSNPDDYRLDDVSLRRCLRAYDLYEAGPPCPILLTGGIPYNLEQLPAVANVMAATLAKLGVAEHDLVVEAESHNTEQNAANSAKIIREKGWQNIALVTSATHLRRSHRLFQRQQMDVIPIGCNFRTPEFQWNIFAFLPREKAVERNHETFHELLGMVFLVIRGQW